jgi:hypothetical protein
LPEFPSYKNGRKDCKNARDVIQSQHLNLCLTTESLWRQFAPGPFLRGLELA